MQACSRAALTDKRGVDAVVELNITANAIGIQFFLVFELDAAERARAVSGIGAALAQGKPINRVDPRTFGLDDAAAAHEAVEQGASAKVVVTL